VPGEHMAWNALAAAATGVALGLTAGECAAGLKEARVSSWRMEITEGPEGIRILNDAYNANPASMAAAIDALIAIGRRGSRRTVAVLGEMKELGPETEEAHREVGRTAAEAGVDLVVAVGAPAHGIADGAADVSGWAGEAVVAAGRDEALAWVRKNVAAADVVLVKASRGAALEHIADGLLDAGPQERGSTP
jgi:UDP-N-acetylmuramoyl-tripeptide--D-alanyl-D-alanine ligase